MVKKRYGIYVSDYDQPVEGDLVICFHMNHPTRPWLLDYEKFLEVNQVEKYWVPYSNRRGGWVISNSIRTPASLAALIMPPPEGLTIDHDSRDPFDNRVANLFPRTPQQQNQNRGTWGKHSQFQGVTYNRRYEVWYTRLKVDGVTVYRKQHLKEIDAARDYERVHRGHPATAWMWKGQPYKGFISPLARPIPGL